MTIPAKKKEGSYTEANFLYITRIKVVLLLSRNVLS